MPKKAIITRGAITLLFAILIEVTTWLIYLIALFQFGWMLFTDEENKALSQLGGILAQWIQDATQFITGASDMKPFPWPSE